MRRREPSTFEAARLELLQDTRACLGRVCEDLVAACEAVTARCGHVVDVAPLHVTVDRLLPGIGALVTRLATAAPGSEDVGVVLAVVRDDAGAWKRELDAEAARVRKAAAAYERAGPALLGEEAARGVAAKVARAGVRLEAIAVRLSQAAWLPASSPGTSKNPKEAAPEIDAVLEDVEIDLEEEQAWAAG